MIDKVDIGPCLVSHILRPKSQNVMSRLDVCKIAIVLILLIQ